MKAVSVFGHFNTIITDGLINKLRTLFEDLILNQDFGIFYFGGFGAFDDICYKIVSELKLKYTHIKRIFCLSDPKHETFSKRPKWLQQEKYEEYIYLPLKFDYWYTRIYYRNSAMIDKSNFVLFYAENRKSSGAYKAYKYAVKCKKPLINLAEQ